tara:strand:+ start:101 stop:595 length:495 start_codon:yes stop_codon:yes gene_type:complete
MASEDQSFEKFKRRIRAFGGVLTKGLKQELVRRKMIASGGLKDSIEHNTKFQGNKAIVSVQMSGHGHFLNRNLHGRPPIGAILAWMDLKGIEPKKGQTKKQAAFLIARAIGKSGYVVYNNYPAGWADMIYARELQRQLSKIPDWYQDIVVEMEDYVFKFVKGKK